MKKITLFVLISVLSLSLILSGCSKVDNSNEGTKEPQQQEMGADEQDLRFVFVTPAGGHQFWVDVADGVLAASKKFGVKTDVVGPANVDIMEQIEAIEAAIADKPDGILTMAINPDPYKDVINKAVDAGIPVVLLDGDCPDSKRSFFVRADAHLQGVEMAETIAEDTDGKAKIGIVTAGLDIEIINWRLDGMREVVDKYPEMEIIDIQDSRGDSIIAAEKATAMMQTYPEINVMVAAGASDVPGVGKAIKELGKKDSVIGIAFNDDPQGLDFLKEGVLDYIICVLPFEYGYVPLEALYQVVTGKIDQNVDNVIVRSIQVTKENVDTYKKVDPPSLDALLEAQKK